MYSLIYRSTAGPSLTEQSIKELLEKAKIRNQRLGISGCLLYHNRKFVHLLEGEESRVKQLYDRILQDPRHTEISLLYSETKPERLFSNWNLIYNNLDKLSDQAVHKRKLFDSIFHQPGVVQSLGKSKLVLWKSVYDLLDEEGVLTPPS